MASAEIKRVGLVGARGYTGRELIALIEHHPRLELAFASSRELAGQRVCDVMEGVGLELTFESLGPEAVAARGVDVVVLALPNGVSGPFVAALDAADAGREVPVKIVDLSADGRFDEAWTYCWPERLRETIRGASRIANPGCYATGMQAALWPIVDLLDGPPHCFGISGYSGAGTKPSPKNDPEVLHDNLLPYSLSGHTHEREVSRQLDHAVRFMPHVASFFRGITLTISAELRQAVTRDEIKARYVARFGDEPLVRLSDEAPLVRDAAGDHHVSVGGWTLSADGRRLVVVATLDNLLKGAATQALQNINLVCGLDEFEGVPA